MRRSATVLVAVLVVLAPLPAAAAVTDAIDAADGVVTPAASDLPEDTIRYGAAGDPGYVVQLDNESDVSALEDWANTSDGRELIERPSGANSTWALVAAGAPSVTGGLGTNQLSLPLAGTVDLPWYYTGGLAERSYVSTVDVEQEVGVADPVSLRSNKSWTEPSLPLRARLQGGLDTDASPRWLAFSEDTEERSLQEARDAIGDDAVTANGTGITVAPIDTGCNVLDDGLRGQLYGNGTAGSDLRIDNASKSFISDATVNETAGNYTAIRDGNGHGSWVTSAIASAADEPYQGVAPDASILCLQALGSDGSGSSHDIAQAIRYAANNGADVASLSLGSPVYSQEIASAVRYAERQGTVVVVAAGNSRQTVRWLASPSDTPGATITVGAANTSESTSAVEHTLPAYFSQQGPDNGATDLSGGVTEGQQVDVVAPGMNLTAPVATKNGLRENTTLSGTSMATPLVAGAVAQALEANPDWQGEPDAVHDELRNVSRPMPDATIAAVGTGYLAADHLANGTAPTTDQRTARTAAARARDDVWQAASDGSGGLVSRIAAGARGVFEGVV
jgi:hypothetical protein